MFDKLIESNSVEADFKTRGRYFTVSSVIVGILFLTAVVVSLYAQDFELGTDNFDVSEILAPVAPEAPQPPEPRQQTPPANASRSSNLPQVTESIARMDESPKVPNGVAVTPNAVKERPVGPYTVGLTNIDASGVSEGPENQIGTGSANVAPDTEVEDAATAAVKVVPPPIKPAPPKRPRSIGVVNGNATYLPKPPYPQPAIMVGAQGEVTVQVTIDETGKVISSKAVSGHLMLRAGAEKAAWAAKFTPTLLSKVPVKVTGVIVYRFTR
ncbi:MAG: TonB family protein [Acidobacteriota bacterium]